MDRGWGTVRTTGGELTVDRDALHHHVSPRKRVNGELARFRTGTTGQRLSAVGTILGLALFPLAVAFRLTAAAGSADLTVLFPGLITGLTALQFWNQYVRDVRIPRGAVEELALDTKHRELTVKHSDETLHEAMERKAPYATYVVTQLCYDPDAVVSWIEALRDRGIELPVEVGIPGVMNYQRLLSISQKVGVGDSVKFLRKTTGILGFVKQLIGSRGTYEPDDLIDGLAPYVDDDHYRLRGVHIYTFNQTPDTESWRAERLG